MSLMGSVVTLYVLCWLLAASSSKTVSRILNDTAPFCAECVNGSISLNSSENIQINVTHSSLLNTTGLNQQVHLNKSQNETANDGKPSLINEIKDSTSQSNISFTEKPSTQDISPAAKINDSTTGPQVTTGPLSHTNTNELKDTTAGVRSSATAAHAIIPANATEGTLITASSSSLSTSFASATSSTTTATTTTSPLSTAHMGSTNASITAPKIVLSTTLSTNPKTTGSKPLEPETTTATTAATTTTSTTTTTTTSATTTSRASVPTISSTTPQYLSPVVEVAGQDLTRQLIDKASLLALLLFGLLFFFVVVAVFVTQAYESYRRKDYTQVDYLINGMYTDSGV